MSLSASQHLIERQFLLASAKKKKKKEEEKKQKPQKISFSVDQNSNFEVNFLRLSLKQLRNHSPIYPDCVDAQTFHPTCFYPADGSLSGILFLTMCEITPLFIWMKSEGKPCRVATWVLLTCPSHAARVSRLKKRGGTLPPGRQLCSLPFFTAELLFASCLQSFIQVLQNTLLSLIITIFFSLVL